MGMIKIPNNDSVFKAALNSSNNTVWVGSGPVPAGLNTALGAFGNCAAGNVTKDYSAGTGYVYIENLTLVNGNGFRRLNLYKGTIPTQANIDAMYKTYYNSSAALPRYADQLVEFTLGAATITGSNITIPINSAVSNQGGTATWFMLWSSTTGSSAFPPYANMLLGTQVLIGSVSDLNGSGDMKIATTTIVNNVLYKLPSLTFPTKTKFSW
jgi:hypothetical protein